MDCRWDSRLLTKRCRESGDEGQKEKRRQGYIYCARAKAAELTRLNQKDRQFERGQCDDIFKLEVLDSK